MILWNGDAAYEPQMLVGGEVQVLVFTLVSSSGGNEAISST